MHPLYGTFRRVPRPLLEALTQGFRKRFSIPDAAATIAESLLKRRKELTREPAMTLWAQKRQQGWQPCEAQWLPPLSPADR